MQKEVRTRALPPLKLGSQYFLNKWVILQPHEILTNPNQPNLSIDGRVSFSGRA